MATYYCVNVNMSSISSTNFNCHKDANPLLQVLSSFYRKIILFSDVNNIEIYFVSRKWLRNGTLAHQPRAAIAWRTEKG